MRGYIATLLPKSVFLGESDTVSTALLDDLQTAMQSLLLRRIVELWEYKERLYCSFEKWRNISEEVKEPADAHSAGRI